MKVVGYSFNADQHCPKCTLEYLLKHHEELDAEETHAVLSGQREDITDNEGNQFHPIFETDEAGDTPDHCGDCGEYIDTSWHSDTVAYASERLMEYVTEWANLTRRNPETLDIWRSEMGSMRLDIMDDRRIILYDTVREKEKEDAV